MKAGNMETSKLSVGVKVLIGAALFLVLIFFSFINYCPEPGSDGGNLKGNSKGNLNGVKPKIRLIAMCTPDYRDRGQKGVDALKKFAKKHDYKWELLETKPLGDTLHVNFNKMQFMSDQLKRTDVDYTVLSDVDIEIRDDELRFEELVSTLGDKVLGMPTDTWNCTELGGGFYFSDLRYKKLGQKFGLGQGGKLNAGFIVGKNGTEASKIMQDWVELAKTKCSDEAQIHPRNQRVLEKCVLPKYKGKIMTLPYNFHGLPCSKGIVHGKGKNWGRTLK